MPGELKGRFKQRLFLSTSLDVLGTMCRDVCCVSVHTGLGRSSLCRNGAQHQTAAMTSSQSCPNVVVFS